MPPVSPLSYNPYTPRNVVDGTPMDEAERRAYNMNGTDTLRRSFAQSVAGTDYGMARNDALEAQVAGDLAAQEAARAEMLRQQGLRAVAKPTGSQGWTEATEKGDYGNFAANTLGQLGASMAPVVAATAVGGLAGPLGAAAGAYGSSYQLNRAGNQTEMSEDAQLSGMAPQDQLDYANNAAYKQAALDSILPLGLSRAARPFTGAISKLGAVPKVVGGALVEGGTEMGQDYIAQTDAQGYFPEREIDKTSLVDNFAAGVLGGGVLSGGHASDAPAVERTDGVDLAAPSPAPTGTVEHIAPEDIAANYPDGLPASPEADAVDPDAPVDLGGPSSGATFAERAKAFVDRATGGYDFGSADFGVKGKIDQTAVDLPAGARDALGSLRAAVSGATATSVDAIADLLVRGANNAAHVGATIEETQANMAASVPQRVQVANAMAQALLADPAVPEAVKRRIQAAGEITAANVNTAGVAVGTAMKAMELTDTLRENADKLTKATKDFTSSIADKGREVLKRKNSLMGGSPEERAAILDATMAGLTPEAAADPDTMARISTISRAIAALALRTGEISAKDADMVANLQQGMTLFADPVKSLTDIMATVNPGVEVSDSFAFKVLSVPSAFNDTWRNGADAFAFRMLTPEARAQLSQASMINVGQLIDNTVASALSGGGSRTEKLIEALGQAYGGKERAEMVVDYYIGKSYGAFQGVQEESDGVGDESNVDDVADQSEGGDQGVTKRNGTGDLLSNDYVWASAKQRRPFFTADAKSISDGRRAAIASGRVGPNTLFEVVGLDEFATESVADSPETLLADAISDIKGRIEEQYTQIAKTLKRAEPSSGRTHLAIKKLILDDSPKLAEGYLPQRRATVLNLLGQLSMVEDAAKKGGTKAALRLFSVLRVEGSEDKDLKATDSDIAAMGVDHDSEKVKTSKIRFKVKGQTGQKAMLVLSAGSMVTVAKNKGSHSVANMGGTEYSRAAFADAINAVLDRDDIEDLVTTDAELTAAVIGHNGDKPITAGYQGDVEKAAKKRKQLAKHKNDLQSFKQRAKNALARFDAMDSAEDREKALAAVDADIVRRTAEIEATHEYFNKVRAAEAMDDVEGANKLRANAPKLVDKDGGALAAAKERNKIMWNLAEKMRDSDFTTTLINQESEASESEVGTQKESVEATGIRQYDELGNSTAASTRKPNIARQKQRAELNATNPTYQPITSDEVVAETKRAAAMKAKRAAGEYLSMDELKDEAAAAERFGVNGVRTKAYEDAHGAYTVNFIDTPQSASREAVWAAPAVNGVVHMFGNLNALRKPGALRKFASENGTMKAALSDMGVTAHQFVNSFASNKDRDGFMVALTRAIVLRGLNGEKAEAKAVWSVLSPEQKTALTPIIARSKGEKAAAAEQKAAAQERDFAVEAAVEEAKRKAAKAGKPYIAPKRKAKSVKKTVGPLQKLLDKIESQYTPAQREWVADYNAQLKADAVKTTQMKYRPDLRDKDVAAGALEQEARRRETIAAQKAGDERRAAAPKQEAPARKEKEKAKGERKTGFAITKEGQYTAKDQAKASLATAVIARGSPASSTAHYARDAAEQGIPVNPETFDAADVVFVSAEGNRAGRVTPHLLLVSRAMKAGATILTDDAANRARDYNVGERSVAAHLSRNGYVESEPGVWTPASATKAEPKKDTGKKSEMRPRTGPRPGDVRREAERQAILSEIRRIRGPAIRLRFRQLASELGASGEYTMSRLNDGRIERVIEVAVNASNTLSTAWHESLHDFFAMMNEDYAGRSIKRDLNAVSASPNVMKQLRELLKGHPDAIAQLSNAEERTAYMYQFWAERRLTVDKQATGWLRSIKAFFADILGLVTKEQRAEELLRALHDGRFADPGTVNFVLQDIGHYNLSDRLQQLSPQLNKTLKAIATAAPDRLREFQNEALDLLADKFSREEGDLGFIQKRAQTVGEWTNRLGDLLKGTTALERNTAMRNLQMMKPPSNDLERGLAEYLGDMWQLMHDAGVKTATRQKIDRSAEGFQMETEWEPLRKVENGYFPRHWDAKSIAKNIDAWKAALKKHSNMDADAIDRITGAILTGSGQLDLAESQSSLGFSPYALSAQERGFKFITPANAADFVQFQNKDLADVMMSYTNQAVHRAEYAREFGNDGEQIRALVGQSGITNKKELEEIFKTVSGLEGSLGNGTMSMATKELMSNIMTLQNVVLLPLTVFSQVVDPIVLAARSGDIKDAGRAYVAALTRLKDFVTKKESKTLGEDMAKLLGIISEDSVLEAMGTAWGSTHMSAGARHVNRLFFKYNGMQGWNNTMRIVATEAGAQYIVRNKDDKVALEELGLKPADVKMTADGKLDVSSDVMKKAMFRFVDQAVLRPSASQRPVWMSDPRFMLIGHLKQFVFAMQNVVLKRANKQMDAGNMKPWGILMLAMPAVLAADIAKAALTGSTHMNSWGFKEYFMHAFSRSGLAGVSDFGTQIFDDASRGRLPGESLLGPSGEHLAKILRFVTGAPGVDLGDVIDRTIPGARFI